MVQENHYITRLNIILKSKITIIICITFCILYTYYYTNIKYYQKDNTNITYIEGIVKNIEISDNNAKIYIDKYLVICDYNIIEKLDIKLGNKIKVYGKVKIPNEASKFNLFNYRKYLLSKQIKYLSYSNKI